MHLDLVVRVLQFLVFLSLRRVVLVYDLLVKAVERWLLRLELRQLQFGLLMLFQLLGKSVFLPRRCHLNFWEDQIFVDYVRFIWNIMLNFSILELFIETIQLSHLINPYLVLLFSTDTSSSFPRYGLPLNSRRLGSSTYLVNDIGVYVVFHRWRVQLLQSIPDFFLAGKLQEVLKSIPLLKVNLDGHLTLLGALAQLGSVF